MEQPLTSVEDEISYRVDRSNPDIDGFCHDYTLRRHKYEGRANQGTFRCRADWAKYIGPIERWGGCNPYEGHFGSIVIPFCKPERIEIICYVFEYAFMYDNVVESAAKASLNAHADNIGLDETEHRTVRSVTGTKQIQSKMLLDLLAIDAPCAEVVIDSWKTMISTTAKRDKTIPFANLEEYVDYRIVDNGAPWVDTLMRFGMDMLLTPEEIERLAPIVKPCYAALGLANDYFSFDEEWKEFQPNPSKKKAMTNLIWLFMHWNDVDVDEGKKLARKVTNRYEREYQERVAEFIAGEGANSVRLQKYLTALGHQIPGNVAWSLRCPRYHPELCGQAGKLLERAEGETAKPVNAPEQPGVESPQWTKRGSRSDSSVSDESMVWTSSDHTSPRSSVSSAPLYDAEYGAKKRALLGMEHLLGPVEYINSLPSKKVREAFVDALNVWLVLPDHVVNSVKSIAQTLHNASLMLDDIEDSSPLRRGRPATHIIFGPAETINSANFLLIHAMEEVRKLNDSKCFDIFVEEMQNLFVGQSFDLYWRRHGECPSEEEYLEMVSQKTGGLFRLIARILSQKASTQHNREISIDNLVSLLGHYFQICDDYKNLTEEYTGQKGFCEDLDEGKYSFPLIHALAAQPKNFQLRGLLQESRNSGSLSVSLKLCILEHLRRAGSMEHTEKMLGELMKQITDEVGSLEERTGCSNWVLRLLVQRLRV